MPSSPIRFSFPIQGSGCETRSFIYIDDFIDGVMLAIEKGEHLGIYHIGTSEEISIARLAELVGEAAGRQIEVVPGELMAGSAMRRCPDINQLQKLGFKPRTSLTDGVRTTVRWYLDHLHLTPKNSSN